MLPFIKDRLNFRGLASVKLDSVKQDVFAYLSIDAQVVAAEQHAERNARLLLEALGPYSIPARDEVSVERKHAAILKALVEHLQSQGLRVANERVSGLAPDLFTVSDETPSLFEIKVGAGAGDYLKAVGPLLVYEQLLGKPHRKLLVVPPELKPFAVHLLRQLGIGIVLYHEFDGDFSFQGLEHATESRLYASGSLV